MSLLDDFDAELAALEAEESAGLSDWFHSDTPPLRIGWYLREYAHHQDVPDWWDGQHWHYGDGTGATRGISTFNRRWRGLDANPHKPIVPPTKTKKVSYEPV